MTNTQISKVEYFSLLKIIIAFWFAFYLHFVTYLIPNIVSSNTTISNSAHLFLYMNSDDFCELFFMMSGFLFAMVYSKRIQEGLSFINFIVKRWIRLFTTIIPSVLVLYAFNFLLYKKCGNPFTFGSLKISDLCLDIFFAGKTIIGGGWSSNAPLWFINVLLLCYCLAFFASKLKFLNVCSVFYILAGIFLEVNFAGYNFGQTSRGLIGFFVGCLVFEILKSVNNLKLLKIVSAIILLIFAIYVVCNYKDILYMKIFVCLFVFPEIIILCYDFKTLNKFCSLSFVKSISALSYGIYVWNFTILVGVFTVLKVAHIESVNIVYVFVIYFILHIFVSMISHYVFEQKLGELLIKRVKG